MLYGEMNLHLSFLKKTFQRFHNEEKFPAPFMLHYALFFVGL